MDQKTYRDPRFPAPREGIPCDRSSEVTLMSTLLKIVMGHERAPVRRGRPLICTKARKRNAIKRDMRILVDVHTVL